MLRAVFLGVSLLGATAAIAEPRHVVGQKDGVAYDYTAELTRRGLLVLRGVYTKSGDEFELTVSRYGHVDGWVGGSSVSFDVPPAVRNRAIAELNVTGHELVADGTRTSSIR